MENAERIRPWEQDPRYWEYRSKPVLLLGGSKEDNLFQIDDLESHLNEMVECGANVVRNTMSDRDPDNVYAWHRREDGLYDLDRWNDEYWRRFSEFLRLTEERGIIVQIEVWDRFDYSDKKQPCWQNQPFRPVNNINYDDSVGLPDTQPYHPSKDQQPFFHSIPGMPQYVKGLDRIRSYQEQFVDKMLSYSLQHGNVLYCMNNETSTPVQWGQYWISHIRKRAEEAGVDVYCTDMFDDIYRGDDSEFLGTLVDTPEYYDFVDISQVNSRLFGRDHWEMCKKLLQIVRKTVRPVNHTKIYSDGGFSFGSGTPQDGIERFWHNILLGSSSARFHRPGAGIGLNDIAKACIRAAREVGSLVAFHDLRLAMEYLASPKEDRAYCAAAPGTDLVVFIPHGETVDLNKTGIDGSREICWIPIAPGEKHNGEILKDRTDGPLILSPPSPGPWTAVIRSVGKEKSLNEYD